MVRRSAVVAQVFGSLLYNSLLLPVTWSLPGPGQLSGFYNHHRSQHCCTASQISFYGQEFLIISRQ